MRIYAELGFKSYIPSNGLKKGMLFTYKLNHGHKFKEQVGVRKLEIIPIDEEKFVQENGYPVYPVITDDDDDMIAEEAQIGWFDSGPDSEDLEDITIEQLNVIMDVYEGTIAIEVDEETGEAITFTDEKGDGIPKVIVSYPEEWEEDYDDDDDNDDGWGTDDNDEDWGFDDMDDDSWKED